MKNACSSDVTKEFLWSKDWCFLVSILLVRGWQTCKPPMSLEVCIWPYEAHELLCRMEPGTHPTWPNGKQKGLSLLVLVYVWIWAELWSLLPLLLFIIDQTGCCYWLSTSVCFCMFSRDLCASCIVKKGTDGKEGLQIVWVHLAGDMTARFAVILWPKGFAKGLTSNGRSAHLVL